jgi:TrmH family RNA methyltransferase
VIEGPVLVREALAAGVDIEAVYVGPGAPQDLTEVAVPVMSVAAGVVEKVATTVTPQPVLAVARIRPVAVDELAGRSFLVVCARVADPGNLGTILRTAEAAGADGVVVTPGTVDAHSPKVVRSSGGALFHVPVVTAPLDALRGLGLPIVGAVAAGGRPYTKAPVERPLALVLGSEAHGLDDDERALCDLLVSIPHAGRAESLNVAMAAAVLCFEVARRSH